jgi:hypothetical protein
MFDFNEAEVVGSTDQVNIVSQIDRYRGAYRGMGDWTSTKRFYLTRDRNLNQIGSQEIADLGELNMADGDTLVDFITWAVTNYPARKYALIMSDHGAGWPGGWNDPAPGGLGQDQVVVAQLFGVDGLWLMELDRALEQARRQTGLAKFDLIGFDACLMGQLEVFTALEPHARYAVASQEVEPALGWAYGGFLAELINKPGMDGAELSKLIVESYIDYDLRILDDASRRDLVAQEFGFTGNTTSEEVAEAKGRDITLTAVDLAAIPQVNTAVDNLATALAQINPKATSQARAYAQAFQSIFGEEVPSPYIDLGHFAQLVVELSGDSATAGAAEQVFAALNQTILAEKHGSSRPGATGLTIHFPTSQIYSTADDFGYTLWPNALPRSPNGMNTSISSTPARVLPRVITGPGPNLSRSPPRPTSLRRVSVRRIGRSSRATWPNWKMAVLGRRKSRCCWSYNTAILWTWCNIWLIMGSSVLLAALRPAGHCPLPPASSRSNWLR